MIRVGVLGYGYWGPNLVRNFSDTPGAQVPAIADVHPDRIALARRRHSGVRVTADPHDLIVDPAIDAVAIATPVATHFDLALAALRAGKHVLVEKPMTTSIDQAASLVSEASRRGLVLMVDHTFVYASAVREIKKLVASGAIGDVLFYDAMRTSLGRFQPEVGVLWDLAVHDLAIIDYVLGEEPVSVSASGMSAEPGRPPDLVSATFLFDRRRIAHVHVNWLASVKVRRALIGGRGGMIVYDGIDPAETVKVYEGATAQAAAERDAMPDALRVGYRAATMWAPRLRVVEPLAQMAAHFIDCIETGRRPETDGASATRVIGWLDAAARSIAQQGSPISLQPSTCR